MLTSTQEIKAFVRDFDACSLPKSRWTHHAHLLVGLWYLSHHSPDDALSIVRRRIRAYNDAVGTANTDSSGYHETLTCFFLRGITAHIAAHGTKSLPDSLALLLQSPLASKDWPLAFYSRERLFSVPARHQWLEPDLAPNGFYRNAQLGWYVANPKASIMSVLTDERELAILQLLDGLLSDSAVRAAIDPVALRVVSLLTADPTAALAWEPLPLRIYGEKLPGFIQSSWVFALRGNSASGAERHPNSHQRVVSYRGVGDLQIRIGDDWRSQVLTDDSQSPLLSRWASIPPNVWHQAVVSGTHWVVVSFHTVPNHELIEERPDSTDTELTHQRRYLG